MQDSGYMMDAETREMLEKKMRRHENPKVPNRKMRQAFHDRLRKRARRKKQFKQGK